MSSSLRIRSFSIDGCDIPFSESGNTSSITTTSANEPNTGLSSATIGGIAAGITCGVALIAAAIFAYWFRRRRLRATPSVSADSHGHPPNQPAELLGEQIFELSSPRGLEMPAAKEKQEMATKSSVAELRSKSSVRIVLPQELEGDHPQT
ncbi:uncharacterized protein RCC_03200 [Ramularia collo-cygni]|uniref:Uncharacterized protein n=1 Tax=Ramularia collo-cygni TaxID=112498 RepID=A0A2D3V1H3_9PEZI|nr:uncharacterized protein RCC_03200 [Ramularia collo-cygni]CZT17366.1 uncharacterized protein RCC_03200 [Ramularia collo-cygni]